MSRTYRLRHLPRVFETPWWDDRERVLSPRKLIDSGMAHRRVRYRNGIREENEELIKIRDSVGNFSSHPWANYRIPTSNGDSKKFFVRYMNRRARMLERSLLREALYMGEDFEGRFPRSSKDIMDVLWLLL